MGQAVATVAAKTLRLWGLHPIPSAAVRDEAERRVEMAREDIRLYVLAETKRLTSS